MKLLHILRSRPDDLVQLLVRRMSEGQPRTEVPLYEGRVDYDRLVQQIFEADKVVCWW
jgi:hypothetical protein